MAIGEVHPKKATENGLKILKTSYEIGKVKVTYDGKDYAAELRHGVTGAGFVHWKHVHEKEIAYAMAICFADHCMQYGKIGQIPPPKSNEYLNASEVDRLKMEEEIRIKNIPFEIDIL